MDGYHMLSCWPTYLKIEPLMMTSTVDVRIQDQVIFMLSHLKENNHEIYNAQNDWLLGVPFFYNA